MPYKTATTKHDDDVAKPVIVEREAEPVDLRYVYAGLIINGLLAFGALLAAVLQ